MLDAGGFNGDGVGVHKTGGARKQPEHKLAESFSVHSPIVRNMQQTHTRTHAYAYSHAALREHIWDSSVLSPLAAATATAATAQTGQRVRAKNTRRLCMESECGACVDI